MDRDALGDRMKEYESAPQSRLYRRLPVLIRVDGRAFHTLTRGMEKPIDPRFQRCMWAAARALCEEAQGARLAYVQSDEITVLLYESDMIKSEGWFGYQRDKVVALSAAIATGAFLLAYLQEFGDRHGARTPTSAPTFDARAWNVPPHEVINAFIWRQQDATRNSIAGLGLKHFSHRQLHALNTSQIQERLFTERGVNWNDCPTTQKRGACLVRETYTVRAGGAIDGYEVREDTERHHWIVDENIPIFTQDRAYIERHLDADEARGVPVLGGGERRKDEHA